MIEEKLGQIFPKLAHGDATVGTDNSSSPVGIVPSASEKGGFHRDSGIAPHFDPRSSDSKQLLEFDTHEEINEKGDRITTLLFEGQEAEVEKKKLTSEEAARIGRERVEEEKKREEELVNALAIMYADLLDPDTNSEDLDILESMIELKTNELINLQKRIELTEVDKQEKSPIARLSPSIPRKQSVSTNPTDSTLSPENKRLARKRASNLEMGKVANLLMKKENQILTEMLKPTRIQVKANGCWNSIPTKKSMKEVI